MAATVGNRDLARHADGNRDARTLVCIAVFATACRSASQPTSSNSTAVPAAFASNATMISVVDGDTIDVNIGGHRERVRLIGIDTPETKKPNTPVQCYGPEATRYTKSLLPADEHLHLERDVVARDDCGYYLPTLSRRRREFITDDHSHGLPPVDIPRACPAAESRCLTCITRRQHRLWRDARTAPR